MKEPALLFLRLSLAYLLLAWGADKLVNPSHGAAVAERFYAGLFGGERWMPLYGGAQITLALLLALGWFRRFVYPVVAAITGVTLLGVWRSVVDPWGWVLDGSNALFLPSLTIFAATLALWALREEDRLALDSRRTGGGTRGPGEVRVPTTPAR